jgi:choline-glycine betaine transporter
MCLQDALTYVRLRLKRHDLIVTPGVSGMAAAVISVVALIAQVTGILFSMLLCHSFLTCVMAQLNGYVVPLFQPRF